MISVQEAEEKILAAAVPLGTEERSLMEALGKVLSEPIGASLSLPPFDNSAMDGYAVRSEDLAGATKEVPIRLALVGAVVAGSVRDEPLQTGQAVQIMTGAPMPPGADTVVILEEAKRRDGWVAVDHPVPKDKHIRRQGEDLEAGREVLPAGRVIRPAEMALLASLSIKTVKIFRSPRVAVLATGSELTRPDDPLRRGAIRDSNSVALEAYLKPLGVEILNCGIIPDEEEAVCRAFQAAATCDVILSSGGVSVGEHDLVKRILIREFAFQTIFWRVAMKPGKPMLFGRLGERLLFGLPGNPISCTVCFVRFIAPALRKMMGYPNPCPATRRAVLTGPILIREAEKTHFITARMELGSDPPSVAPTPHQGSGMLTSMTEGNAFIVVPEGLPALRSTGQAGVKELPAGAFVEVIPDV